MVNLIGEHSCCSKMICSIPLGGITDFSWFGKLSEFSPFSFHQLALHLNETSLMRISASGLGCSSLRHQLKPLSCQILTWLIRSSFFTLFKRDFT